MKQVVDGKLYNTETAAVIASDNYWDGHNFEREGRNTFLHKTPKGNYFVLYISTWQGERDGIRPVTKNEAKKIYESLPEKEVSWEVAFDEMPEEA